MSSQKRESHVGPTMNEVLDNMGIEDTTEIPVKTAHAHSQQVLQRKQALAEAKKQRKPLGGAPPLDKEKMAGTLPKPDFLEELPPDMRGVGSGYAANRAMAAGKLDGPVTLAEAKKMEEEARQVRQPISDEAIEELEKPEAQEHNLEGVEEALLEEDRLSLDLDAISLAQRDLVSLERRKNIESRITKMSLSDLISRNEITQDIPIVPGEFEVTFKTFSQKEHLFCLQYLYGKTGSQAYVEELLNTCKVACGLVAINEVPLPDHRQNPGTRDEVIEEKVFEQKMDMILRLPVQLIADLGVQYTWFHDRVNKLLTVGNLKNG